MYHRNLLYTIRLSIVCRKASRTGDTRARRITEFVLQAEIELSTNSRYRRYCRSLFFYELGATKNISVTLYILSILFSATDGEKDKRKENEISSTTSLATV